MFLQLALSAIAWATVVTVMWWLGLHPRKLAHEINNVQNTAVGATFFIVSLISSIFVSVLAGGVPTQSADALEELAWVVGGLALSFAFTIVAWFIAHRGMGPKGENLRQYIQREIIKEQNAALAFFLGALAIAPFLAVLYQIL
jgi:hypothetical protein